MEKKTTNSTKGEKSTKFFWRWRTKIKGDPLVFGRKLKDISLCLELSLKWVVTLCLLFYLSHPSWPKHILGEAVLFCGKHLMLQCWHSCRQIELYCPFYFFGMLVISLLCVWKNIWNVCLALFDVRSTFLVSVWMVRNKIHLIFIRNCSYWLIKQRKLWKL